MPVLSTLWVFLLLQQQPGRLLTGTIRRLVPGFGFDLRNKLQQSFLIRFFGFDEVIENRGNTRFDIIDGFPQQLGLGLKNFEALSTHLDLSALFLQVSSTVLKLVDQRLSCRILEPNRGDRDHILGFSSFLHRRLVKQ